MLGFFKYHGLGNDFVLLDATQSDQLISAELAKTLCDRHRGVGADGVLSVLPSQQAQYQMHIYNADGSVPEMCGNGIRCFAKYLVDKGLASGPRLSIETGRGVLVCQVHRGLDHQVETVTVNMGAAQFERARIPMLGEGTCWQETLRVDDQLFQFSAVSMGNPHLVLFAEADMAQAEKFGPLLEQHALFPNKTNVEWVSVKNRRQIEVIVYERGCGITQACGTGACAATVVMAKADLVDLDQEVCVQLPGGELFVRVEPDYQNIWMRGPAALVFEGQYLGAIPNQ